MKILVADSIAQEGIDTLKKFHDVDVKATISPEDLVCIVGEYEALMVRSRIKITAPIIEAGCKLMVIGRAGVGVDNIDIEAATQRGIVVVNAPTANTVSAAEHTIALILALSRYIPQANASLKSHLWKRGDFIGTEVRGKTLGIIGLGNIGSEVARRAAGLEMKIVACDPLVSVNHARNLGAEMVPLTDLLQQSDFVTVHVTLSDSTRGLISAKELSLMKPTARIINCARGGIINEEDLFNAVESGKIAGAAVDVFTKEPATDNILLGSDKIIVTPHLGASTTEAQTSVSTIVADQILTVLKGESARYAVNAPMIPPETMPILTPFINVALLQGKLIKQMSGGQIEGITISYEGEISNYSTDAVRAAVIKNLLQGSIEERINLINASIIAQNRGITVTEHKKTGCKNYASLITTEVSTNKGKIIVGGTVMRDEPHIVRINNYWLDIKPGQGYLLFCDNKDRPGLIGQVGTITGKANINVSSMHLSRLKPGGAALMILEMDEPLDEAQMEQIRNLPGVSSAVVVKL